MDVKQLEIDSDVIIPDASEMNGMLEPEAGGKSDQLDVDRLLMPPPHPLHCDCLPCRQYAIRRSFRLRKIRADRQSAQRALRSSAAKSPAAIQRRPESASSPSASSSSASSSPSSPSRPMRPRDRDLFVVSVAAGSEATHISSHQYGVLHYHLRSLLYRWRHLKADHHHQHHHHQHQPNCRHRRQQFPVFSLRDCSRRAIRIVCHDRWTRDFFHGLRADFNEALLAAELRLVARPPMRRLSGHFRVRAVGCFEWGRFVERLADENRWLDTTFWLYLGMESGAAGPRYCRMLFGVDEATLERLAARGRWLHFGGEVVRVRSEAWRSGATAREKET